MTDPIAPMRRSMVAIISDLHFEEEQADIICGEGGAAVLNLVRNVPSEVFESMAVDLVGMAKKCGASAFTLVLAGDVFDLHRTQLWLKDGCELRPFVACDKVASTPGLEDKLIEILDAIASEDRVARSLDVLRRLQQGQYYAIPGDKTSLTTSDVACHLEYMPGNHDRLANATPRLRRRVRELLGLAMSDESFPHRFVFSDPPLLIRHGHEYDRYNFAANYSRGEIPEEIPLDQYCEPTFGDFMTVMIASRLPHSFRVHYGATAIASDPLLGAIYLRLLQFDDVRPQSAVVDFFLRTHAPSLMAARPSYTDWQVEIWDKLEPIVRDLLDVAAASAYFRAQCRKVAPAWGNLLLASHIWRFGIPLWALRLFAWGQKNFRHDSPPQDAAMREKLLIDGKVSFVAAGHTHNPQVAHLSGRHNVKSYFTDTGTWRNATLRATDAKSYGRVNATTYVTFYGAEVRQSPPKSDRGFEFWTGFDQTWPVDDFDQ